MNTAAITTVEIDTLTTLPAKPKAKRTAKPKAKTAKAKPAAKATKPTKSGEVTFKAGTKRYAAHAALIRKQGCSLAEAHEFLGWSKDVCGSEFRQIAAILKRKLVRDDKGYYKLA